MNQDLIFAVVRMATVAEGYQLTIAPHPTTQKTLVFEGGLRDVLEHAGEELTEAGVGDESTIAIVYEGSTRWIGTLKDVLDARYPRAIGRLLRRVRRP